MRNIFFLLIVNLFLFNNKIPAGSSKFSASNRCGDVEERSIHNEFNRIKQKSNKRNVERDIKNFRSQLAKFKNNCSINGGDSLNFDYDSVLKKGWRTELSNVRNNIEYYSRIKDIKGEHAREKLKRYRFYEKKYSAKLLQFSSSNANLNNMKDNAILNPVNKDNQKSEDNQQAADDKTDKSLSVDVDKNRPDGARKKQRFPKKNGECYDIDLRNEVLGPPRHQDSVGWCYASVAADLISYKLNQKISSIGVAFAYNDDHQPKKAYDSYQKLLVDESYVRYESDIDGGTTEDAIASATKHGLCLESELSSEDNGYGNLYTVLKLIESRKIKKNQNQSTVFASGNSQNLSKKDRVLVSNTPYNHDYNFFESSSSQQIFSHGEVPSSQADCNEDSSFNIASSVFRNLNPDEFTNVFASSNAENYLDNLLENSCSKIKPYKKLDVEYYYAGDDFERRKEMFGIMDTQLESSNLIGLAYHGGILRSNTIRNGKANHGSVVVGRRTNPKNGKCEYLIRNSLGRGCQRYDSNYDCDEGNVWVPRENLLSNSVAITYID